jgi:mannose-1-phosphate guanylyltransferase
MPKPFLRFFSERSLLQQTYDRACRIAPPNRVYLIVGNQHERVCKEQLPEMPYANLILEPVGRDTSAAIGYASLHLPKDGLMLVMPADHLIPDAAAFAEVMKGASRFLADSGGLITFGVRPTRAETNYGYLKSRQENAGSAEFPVHPIDRFVEKPDRERAEQFLRDAAYSWNAGIFLWRVSEIQELIARHLPDLWRGLNELMLENDPERKREMFSSLPKISIDFGVMEKAERVFVVPASFAWDDIGSWNSVLRVLPADESGNLTRGSVISMDTSNCIIYSDSHTMATAGIHDLIIVQQGTNTLICSREYADRLKELLAKIPS